VGLIDQLLDQHTDAETATILNERGYLSGPGSHSMAASCNTSDNAISCARGTRDSELVDC
jgi:hypothetical protein